MRKVHDIVPKRRSLKKSMLRLRLHLWARGLIICARKDIDLQKEMSEWPDGFTLFFQILPDEPYVGLKKDASGLHIIKSFYPTPTQTLITFKNLIIAQEVLYGRMTLRQAFCESRFVLKGNSQHYSSVIKAMMLIQKRLFPRLVDYGSSRPGFKKRVSRLLILLQILFMGNERKEVLLNDSEVLRVFE